MTGQVTGSIGETRTEQDYARFLEDLFTTGGSATKWRVIADNLNTHISESVVRLVGRLCDLDDDLGEKGKSGMLAACSQYILVQPATSISRSWASRPASCSTVDVRA